MHTQTYSDDLTSTDYISSPRGNYCGLCKISEGKLENSLQGCDICFTDFCESCAGKRKELCTKCESNLRKLEISLKEKTNNFSSFKAELTKKSENLEQDKKTFIRICDFGEVNKEDNKSEAGNFYFNNPILEIDGETKIIAKEKERINKKKEILNGLEEKIAELNEELKTPKLENLEKKDSNKIRKFELVEENKKLKELIKEFEYRQILLESQIIDVLEMARDKILNEKQEKMKNECEDKEEKCSLKERIRELEEDLNETKENLERLLMSGNQNVELLSSEEDPAGPNCKCNIY